MDFTSFDELKTKIATYLGRDDLTTEIPGFIRGAEVRLRRELRIRQTVTTASLTLSSSTVALPSDFLELREIHLDTNPVGSLEYLAPTTFYRNADTKGNGQPVFYTTTGSNLVVGPAPDTTYTAIMLYYAAPDFLSASNASNTWVTTTPDLLLYGSLAEAEPYLMNDARIQTWAQLYDRASASLQASDDRAEFAGNPLTLRVI